MADRCMCPQPIEPDGSECMNFSFGYPWCRSCGEHHRPPECPIDSEGCSLAFDGQRWADLGMPTDNDRNRSARQPVTTGARGDDRNRTGAEFRSFGPPMPDPVPGEGGDPQARVEAERRRLVEGKMSVQEAEAYLSALESESVEIADREVALRVADAEARAVEAEKALRELDAAIEGGLVMALAPTQQLYVKLRADHAGWKRIVEARRAARIVLGEPDA